MTKPRVVHIGRVAGTLGGKPVQIDHALVVDLGTPAALDIAANSGFMEFDFGGDDDDTLAVRTEPAAAPKTLE